MSPQLSDKSSKGFMTLKRLGTTVPGDKTTDMFKPCKHAGSLQVSI